MRAIVIRSRDALSEWQEPWSKGTDSNPFGTFDFVDTWLQAFPEAEPFVVLIVSADEHLLGVAPWCLVRTEGGVRVLTGVGADDAGYHDPLWLAGSLPLEAAELLYATVFAARREWDLLRLCLRVDESALLMDRLRRTRRCFETEQDYNQHAIIQFEGDWPSYWQVRAGHFEGNLRRARKLLRLRHRYLTADAANIDRLLVELFKLHHARLEATRDWHPFYAFLKVHCLRALKAGTLELHALEVEGTVAAIDLSLRTGRTIYGVMRAYRPDFANLGVGFQLTLWEFERFCGQGVRRVDCGAGRYEWKERFRTGTVRTRQLLLPSSLSALRILDWRALARPWVEASPLLSAPYAVFRRLNRLAMDQKMLANFPNEVSARR